MALEDIFRALDEQADAECEQLLREARDHGDVILADAEEQAEAIRTARVADAERVTRARASKSVNAAKLEARKRVAAVKEQAVGAAFTRATELLLGVRASERYPAAFQAMAKEALEGLEGDIEVIVDPADEALASKTLASLGVGARMSADASTAGGLVVVLPGGRITRRNTLEDRLDKVSEQAQAAVAEIIFS
jgi:vacuolar-type H+-ATPase subunit E/Vma4